MRTQSHTFTLFGKHSDRPQMSLKCEPSNKGPIEEINRSRSDNNILQCFARSLESYLTSFFLQLFLEILFRLMYFEHSQPNEFF